MARFAHAVLNHAPIGFYRWRFNIPGEQGCPCGSPMETRSHIIDQCPYYWSRRSNKLSRVTVDNFLRMLRKHPSTFSFEGPSSIPLEDRSPPPRKKKRHKQPPVAEVMLGGSICCIQYNYEGGGVSSPPPPSSFIPSVAPGPQRSFPRGHRHDRHAALGGNNLAVYRPDLRQLLPQPQVLHRTRSPTPIFDGDIDEFGFAIP